MQRLSAFLQRFDSVNILACSYWTVCRSSNICLDCFMRFPGPLWVLSASFTSNHGFFLVILQCNIWKFGYALNLLIAKVGFRAARRLEADTSYSIPNILLKTADYPIFDSTFKDFTANSILLVWYPQKLAAPSF